MPKRIIKVLLTLEDRKCLEKILNSEKCTHHDKQKAQVLLLTDVGEHGPKTSLKDVVDQVKLSPRSVGRIREAYAKNSSVHDVFRFAKLSDQTDGRRKESRVDDPNHKSAKKNNIKYVEIDDSENESFLIENIKCRVTLTKEERDQLHSVIKEGKHSLRKINRAKILLLADEGIEGPAKTDEEIAEKLDVSMSTVARVRRLLITKGQMEDVLNFNHQNAGRPRKIDGEVEAVLVAQACSKPPKGRCRWTLRLLADRLVELEMVDSITHGAIANALKKMNLSLGSAKNG